MSATKVSPQLSRELIQHKFREHLEDMNVLLESLGSSTTGLTTAFANQRMIDEGRNRLTPPKKTPWYILFFREITNPFALLLWAGGLLCFVGAGLDDSAFLSSEYFYLGVVLVLVNFLTGCFGYLQNAKSNDAMAALQKLSSNMSTVTRDGQVCSLDSQELVRGDLVTLKTGEKIPADMRLTSAINFKVDNSALTGESEEQPRSGTPTHDDPRETENLVFLGTLAVDGSATGVVLRTGDHTVLGEIAKLALSTSTEETTLHKEIHHFISIVTGIALVLGVSFFVLNLFISPGKNFMDRFVHSLVFGIGIIVANVPEGLLATLTLSLTLTAKRMKQNMVLVKNLETVETLGSTSCICSDKTGTLTMNQMSGSHVWADTVIYGSENLPLESPTVRSLLEVSVLSSEAAFDPDVENMKLPISSRQCVGGNASDHGLLKFAEELSPGLVTQLRREYDISGEGTLHPGRIPFNSRYKYAANLVNLPNNRVLLCVKGAPEQLLERCSTIMLEGQPQPLTPEYVALFEQANLELASQGERVLGFAQRLLDSSFHHQYKWAVGSQTNFPQDKLCFLGVITLVDPPRPNVPHAIAECKSAGIQVIMVTGDQPATAKAIARQIGIMGKTKDECTRGEEADSIVVHGSELHTMTDERLSQICETYSGIVFARTSPEQKLRITEANKNLGRIVAVTGDGVNDSPALKAAHIGVAMGSGTDVAISASDMVLSNDDFGSIVSAIREGRLIFDNIKKSIAYTLTSNIPEIAPFLTYVILGLPLPMTTVLILLIDLGSDLAPAISYAKENPEQDIMLRKPRNAKTDRLVTFKLVFFSYALIGFVQALGGFITYFTVLYDYGFAPSGLVYATSLEYERFNAAEVANSSLEALLTASDQEDRLFTGTTTETLDWMDKETAKFHLCGGIADAAALAPCPSTNLWTFKAFHELCWEPREVESRPVFPDSASYMEPFAGSRLIFVRDSLMAPDCKEGLRTQDNLMVPLGFWHEPAQIRGISDLMDDQTCQFGTLSDQIQVQNAGVSTPSLQDSMVCGSTDALKYAQSAYYVSIIVVQYATLFFCKTRKLSLIQQGASNWFQNFAVLLETLIGIAVLYLPFLHKLLDTRSVEHWHFAIPAMPFAVFNFLFDEGRKAFVRRGCDEPSTSLSGKPLKKTKLGRLVYRYTYY